MDSAALEGTADLVLAFGATSLLKDARTFSELRSRYGSATIVSCSTAGEICGTSVCDDSLIATAVRFASSRVRGVQLRFEEAGDSYAAGQRLASEIEADGLVHVLILSDGLRVNGSQLVQGLSDHLPPEVTVSGGLAGDGERFETTLVGLDSEPEAGGIVALGLYGERLRLGFGSLGGWDPFGPEREVTRSRNNVLYELDGASALSLYKRYLGEHAGGLPASALLFPLSLRTRDGATEVVRTVLSVDEESQSMTFAGDVPEGSVVRFMKANFDRLIDGAEGSARATYTGLGTATPELAILVSCVGRKLILKQRTEEELEAVRDVLGEETVLTGFYSYGEISPFTPTARCELHNQTMTITAISEEAG